VGLAYLNFHLELLWPSGNLTLGIGDSGRPLWPLRSLFFEAGFVAIALAYVMNSKSTISRISESRTILLPIILIVAFSLRSLWGYALPFFYGYDTAHYIGVAHFLSDRFTESLSILFLHTKTIPHSAFPNGIPSPEPLTYLLFASLVHAGVPDAAISRIVIPLFSTATILPFYLIVRDLYGSDAGLIGALIIAMSPMQFAFLTGLYRNLIGNFFMLCSIYLITHEPSKHRYGAVFSTVLLFLTYVANVLILFLTMFVYRVACRKRMVFHRTLLVLGASAAISLFPIWYFGPSAWGIGNGAVPLSPVLMAPGLAFDLPFLLAFLAPTLIFAVPSVVRRNRLDLAFCFLSGLVLLFLILGITGYVFFPPARAVLYLEFPLIMLASKWISATPKPFDLGAVIAGWSFWQSMWFVSLPFAFGPSPVWSYYEKISPTMPAVALTPDILGWLVSCFLFSAVVLASYALWRDYLVGWTAKGGVASRSC